jgi:hypothetical protein
MVRGCVLAFTLVTAGAYAQTWEVGAIGGYGYAPKLTVQAASASANAGLASGGAVGAYGGEDSSKHWGGEARYLYRYSNFNLSSGNTSVSFGGHTHIIEGDLLFYFKPKESRFRPFIAFGGGIKVLQGTGNESASQPLSRFAALTATREVLPTAGIGAGVKIALKQHVRLRIEVRDYISAAPSSVIAPAPGASISGLSHDILGLAGLSYTW